MNIHNGIRTGQPFGAFIDEFFNRSISDIIGTDVTSETPSVNIIERDDAFLLEIAAPGLTKKDFKISINKDELMISADEERDTEEIRFKRKEYDFRKFTRKFRLPKTVNKDTVTAKYDLGILTVMVEKTPEAKDKGAICIEID